MRFISSILLIVLMGMVASTVCLKAQPAGASYANGQNNGGLGSVTGAVNAVGANSTLQPAVMRTTSGTVWLHLNFPQVTSASATTTVYIRTDQTALNLGTDVKIQAYNNNTFGTSSPVTTSSTKGYYLSNADTYLAVTITGIFQSLRISLDKPLLSNSEIKIYHAFYNTAATNTSNPYPFNASDCGLPNVTTKQDVIQLLAEYKVINPGNAIDGDTVTHSSFTNNGVVLGSTIMKQTFYFNGYSNQSDAIRIVVSRTGSILAANLIAGIELRAYNGETLVSSTQLANALLDADLLGLLNGNKRATFYYYPKQSNGEPFIFDRLELSFNIDLLGVALGSNALNVHDVRRVPGAPSVPVTSTVCTNVGTVVLSAASALEGTVNNLSFNWYTSLRGGNSLITNKQYSLTGLTTVGNRSYYVDVTKPGCPLPSARHQVNLNIVNAPTTPPINLTP